jgi:hypothetical protein
VPVVSTPEMTQRKRMREISSTEVTQNRWSVSTLLLSLWLPTMVTADSPPSTPGGPRRGQAAVLLQRSKRRQPHTHGGGAQLSYVALSGGGGGGGGGYGGGATNAWPASTISVVSLSVSVGTRITERSP